ncbi:SGNH/GDSL hydrolase family protein [Actinospica sp. MGRD01-02]|uniref:SGNH/GDSL hydrolase family protein n=1 Tax=Actinospica acidithermotolerans TaxID=2828514 RepID=A0A941EC62_9ACTN|nr:SGNH/GDSL hydrolase family protein [Actinospica acidithermotolerans]MBR7827665.1 SGNH/GDSL hydrolase family protein [Actinospica acidithermotolerans]
MPTFFRRSLSVVATTGTAAAIAIGGGGAAHASSASYVALGDSYSSGVGAGSYTSSSGSCDRSTNAYPYLWDSANAPTSFTDNACSGATTSTVESSQLSGLSSSTTLVSITVGGNDVGFSTVMEDCILEGTSACESAVSSAETEAENDLPAKLDTLYSDIKADAPNAHVVVIGYPEFYDLAESGTCAGLSYDSRSAINGGADTLDSVISTEAAKYSDFSYVDIRSYFSGHEICDSSAWLHSFVLTDTSESYHPTATGQADAYYPAFEAGVAE